MKKAKYFLTLIIFGAIISCSLAFKAKTFTNHFLYTGALGSGVCTTKVIGVKIWSGPPNVAASTAPLASGCPDECFTDTAD